MQDLRCPRCKGALQTHSDDLTCSQCRQRFPRLQRIWTLLADTERELRQLRSQAYEFVRENTSTRDKLLAQLAGRRQHRLTRARVERVRSAMELHRARLLALLAQIGIEPEERTEDDRARVPGEGRLTAYYHQIHRDWGWDADGTDENRVALTAVKAALPAGGVGRMLVLGPGASRLPWDVHRAGAATCTIAMDLNPLPLVVAAAVTAGETIDLFEFPLSPRTSETAVVDRTLRCDDPGVDNFASGPNGPSEQFHFVLADGLDPPVRDEAFDTVFTPWFIDQIPTDLATLIPTIRRVLRPGGTWLNHGPLLYHPSHTMFAHRYRADEVLALLVDHGFEVRHQSWQRMLYMQSPAGSQGRTEGVLTFAAVRGEHAAVGDDADEPEWIENPDVPVEALPAFHGYEPPHPMFARVLALIDGRRTTRQIAELLIRDHGLPENVALGGVQTCLQEIYRATRQAGV